jgi:hypothetical protein
LDVLFSTDASYPFFLPVHYPRRWRLPDQKHQHDGGGLFCTQLLLHFSSTAVVWKANGPGSFPFSNTWLFLGRVDG